MAYERKMAIASDERMATLCFDELVNFPYINTCFYKPTTTHLGQCNFLAHLFDGIHCNDPPILKFPPTKITVDDPYTCYLFKAENCTGEYEQFIGGSGTKNLTIDYFSLRCDPST